MASINGEGSRIKEIQDRKLMQTNRAEPDGLQDGDFVQWDSSGGTAKGKIESIEREGSINVPDTEFTIQGTPEDPAALIRIYRQGDDGYEETDRLVGHKFSTLSKIAALRFFDGNAITRSASTEFKMADEDDRTLEFPFGSEKPVERYYGMEVLSMDEKSMDLSRLNDGAPLLYQHDADRIIGVVQKAYIKNKRAFSDHTNFGLRAAT